MVKPILAAVKLYEVGRLSSGRAAAHAEEQTVHSLNASGPVLS
jgi:hypothetical protein